MFSLSGLEPNAARREELYRVKRFRLLLAVAGRTRCVAATENTCVGCELVSFN
jgi:hypothetical protein